MQRDQLKGAFVSAYKFFTRTTSCFTDADSAFAPEEGMLTVSQQIAHVAHTFDWFIEGAFSESGFNLDFEKQEEKLRKVTSVEAARHWLEKSVEYALTMIEEKTDEELEALLPPGPVLGGMPRYSIGPAVTDHTAHHRGSLAVYARLLGRTPLMPYGED